MLITVEIGIDERQYAKDKANRKGMALNRSPSLPNGFGERQISG